MFPQKPGKKELPDKGPYTYHPILNHAKKTRIWNQGYYRVVSIDPAEKNLAFRIEKRDYDGINITTEVFIKWDLTAYSTAYTKTDTSYIYSYIMNDLDKYTYLFRETHLVLIERQMAINFRMVRFSMCLISYFLRKMRKGIFLPMIYEINSQLKSSQLGCPKGITKKQLKEWGIDVSLHILEYRGDTISYNIIKNEKGIGKKDDLADTVIQIEAFFKYMGLKTTFEHLNVQATLSYSLTIQPKFPNSVVNILNTPVNISTSYPTPNSNVNITSQPDNCVIYPTKVNNINSIYHSSNNTIVPNIQQNKQSNVTLSNFLTKSTTFTLPDLSNFKQ